MIEVLLLAVIVILSFLAVYLYLKSSQLEKELEELAFQKRSQSVKYGKLTEQFVPFIDDFPFDSTKFRFLGDPIDGVVFEENEIIFCEFKAANARLNERQRKIKELVKEKKVNWFEFKLK